MILYRESVIDARKANTDGDTVEDLWFEFVVTTNRRRRRASRLSRRIIQHPLVIHFIPRGERGTAHIEIVFGKGR